MASAATLGPSRVDPLAGELEMTRRLGWRGGSAQATRARIDALRSATAGAPGHTRNAATLLEVANGLVLLGLSDEYAESRRDLLRDAVTGYARVIQDFPEDPRIDEALFGLGYCLELLDENERTREVFYRLLSRFPRSPLVPYVYLVLANHYFDEGDRARAQPFFAKVCEFPPETNAVFLFAELRLAECQRAGGDVEAARSTLEDLQQRLQTYSGEFVSELREAASRAEAALAHPEAPARAG